MKRCNDNLMYPEHQPMAMALTMALFENAYSKVNKGNLDFIQSQIRSCLNFPYWDVEHMSFCIARDLIWGAKDENINIDHRAKALCEIMPSLKHYLIDSRIVIPKMPASVEDETATLQEDA